MNIGYNEKYKHRMGKKKLVLNGIDGKPVANTGVTVRQSKHDFLFGCAEFSSIPYANDELDEAAREKSEVVFKNFFELFNYTTLPFYWANFEPVKNQPDTARIKKAAQWFLSKGCAIKGHTLCWHTLAPSWLLDMSNSEILSTQLSRIKRDVTEFAGYVDIWDVINEAVIMPVFDKYDNGITRICKEKGRINTVREMFSEAKKANPDAKLLINDFVYTSIDAYEILIEGCLEAGIPIDAIGIQSHMHQGYWGVGKTLEILERFSQFNLPIHFTENTIVSGHTMPPEIIDFNDYVIDSWPSTNEGEERQAREAAMHYRTLFEHPAVESITWWDFMDGQWLGAPVGLMTRENRIKPVYEELHKLIKGEWWTGSLQTATDSDGSITVTGFYGEYEVDCCGRKGRFIIEKGNKETADIVVVT